MRAIYACLPPEFENDGDGKKVDLFFSVSNVTRLNGGLYFVKS